MIQSVLFVVNSIESFDFELEAQDLLKSCAIEASTFFPESPSDYHLVILWNYQTIVPNVDSYSNIILFHASELPKGKGWAPIYYALSEQKEYYTLTGIRAANSVDSGEIVGAARYKITPDMTATHLRTWDTTISLILIQKLLTLDEIDTTPQVGSSSYNRRRKKEDNEIVPLDTIASALPHLRACEPSHPAYFIHDGVRFNIQITPHIPPSFPEDLEIFLPSINAYERYKL
ncbi:hypothetical protein HOH87_03165 [bacterium]|jgi:methionyl-tRNA formyltransferase|nr:hypothetical protein [bacterium]